MKPVLGSLGANTLVILTAAESNSIQEVLELAAELHERADSPPGAALSALRRGIARGTAHLEAEFKALQQEKKRGK